MGLLLAWLVEGQHPQYTTAKEHLKHKPSLQHRQAMRFLVDTMDGIEQLLECERPVRADMGEPPEPLDIA